MADIKRNIYHIKKEIYEIQNAIINGESYETILDSYEEYSKSMIDYIKLKDKTSFKLFFNMLKEDLETGATEESIRKEYMLHIGVNKQLIIYILDKIFNNDDKLFVNSDEEEDDDNDDDFKEKKEELNDIKIENVIQNFDWRKNQLDAINNTKKQNFSPGVHNQIMGAGKTYLIYKTIDEHFNSRKNNNIYIITCFRQEILKDLFFDENGDIDEDKKEFLKNAKIIDLDKYRIINRVHEKSRTIKLSKRRSTILVVNTDYLKLIYKNDIDLDRINMVILDECHSVSANKFYKILHTMKYDYKIPIIGFSATPLRDKAGDKVKDIFSNTFNENEKNKKLNIISNYDLISAIKDNVILPPYYILCEINKTLNNKIGKSNKDITKKVLEDTLKLAPHKKIIGWCRSKIHLKEYYKYIKKNFPYLTVYCSSCFDKELNKEGYNTNWNEFSKKDSNCILLYINRGREGSDIKNLDTAIYLDIVRKRSLLVALQTSGRVLRKDKNNKKTHGLIIDPFINVDGIQIAQMTAEKIIDYYKQVFSLSDGDDNKEQIELYNKMIEICNNIEYDEKKEEINIKIDDNDKHNMKIKLQLNTLTYDFNKMKQDLNKIIANIYNIDKNKKFNIIIEKIKSLNKMNDRTLDFGKEYDKIHKKQQLDIPLNSNDLSDEYKEYFDNNTWYNLLKIDMKNYYQTIDECKSALKKLYNSEISEKKYYELILNDDKIPVNPKEFYRLQRFKDIEIDFNDEKKKYLF